MTVQPTGWEQIHADLLGRIQARTWPPGALLPSEDVLATEFGCARATVNRAMRALAEAGVIERRRRAGTRVTVLPVRRATVEIPVIRREVEARGHQHGFRLLDQRRSVPPLPVASRLGLAAGQALMWLETLHLADGRPWLRETRWLNPAILPADPPDFAAISVNEWLVTQISYATGEISFAADSASHRDAEVLGIPAGTALFITERLTRSATAPITLARLAHAPGYRLHLAL